MTKFYYIVKTQFENLGDALINRELIKLMSNHGQLYINTRLVPSRFKKEIFNLSNHENIKEVNFYIFFIQLILDSLFQKKPIYFFLNPGGYDGEIDTKSYLKKHVSYLFFLALKFLNVNICQLGISYSNLGIKHGRHIRKLSSTMHTHSVRDTLSKLHANSQNIAVSAVLPDLALNIPSYTKDNTSSFDILFSFREPKNLQTKNQIVDSIGKLLTTYPNSDIGYQVKFDEYFCKEIAHSISFKCLKILDMTASIDSNIELYSKYKFVVSNRLHVLLLALISGSTPIAAIELNENSKIVGIFHDLGLSSNLLEVHQLSVEKIKNHKSNTNRDQILTNSSKQIEIFFSHLTES